jgi:hypothetical protein
VSGCCECGEGPSLSGATDLVTSSLQVSMSVSVSYEDSVFPGVQSESQGNVPGRPLNDAISVC